MAAQIITPSALPAEPPRCNQEIPQSNNPANCDAIICGALAEIFTESGPRCASCFAEFGGQVVAEVEDKRPVRVIWRIANTEAAKELDARFARIGNGLFCRVGKRGRQ